MVGLASGGMESASNAPRGARVSDMRSRNEGTGQDSHRLDDQKPPLGKSVETREVSKGQPRPPRSEKHAASPQHAVVRLLPVVVNVPSLDWSRKRKVGELTRP